MPSFHFRLLVLLIPTLLSGILAPQASSADVLKSGGRADRAGDVTRTGAVRWEAIFSQAAAGPDLSSGLEVFLGAVLTELDGTPLVAIDGLDIEASGLQASRGARPDRAKFEVPGRDRSGARVRISSRLGKLRVVAQINRARVLVPAACLAGADMATLRSSVTLQGQDGESTSYTFTQDWKCSKRRSCDGCYDLKTIRSSIAGHGQTCVTA